MTDLDCFLENFKVAYPTPDPFDGMRIVTDPGTGRLMGFLPPGGRYQSTGLTEALRENGLVVEG